MSREMAEETVIDVQGLDPPEPMERILEALEILGPDAVLRVKIHREPFPLYTILQDSGFEYRIDPGSESLFELVITKKT
ncbi:MAG: DUF2249 domain-containing protein [Arenicellales bacterium]|jgi:hypothetical protein|nr:DUF2249 domain-containing protein [Arenicellales bacterium]MDP6672782.1 DUF2249 domain-containing protein [Arenicellales bacterium]MDP6724204.1 DUF2249 domain-containing protein [Arenicellales bacterium]|tara:strand:+ start:10392 stop:10628 length:237 start_codon:yes stop_codon:yes gene_type:complete